MHGTIAEKRIQHHASTGGTTVNIASEISPPTTAPPIQKPLPTARSIPRFCFGTNSVMIAKLVGMSAPMATPTKNLKTKSSAGEFTTVNKSAVTANRSISAKKTGRRPNVSVRGPAGSASCLSAVGQPEPLVSARTSAFVSSGQADAYARPAVCHKQTHAAQQTALCRSKARGRFPLLRSR
jgi:hypothetical protein